MSDDQLKALVHDTELCWRETGERVYAETLDALRELQRMRRARPKKQHLCPSCGLSEVEEAQVNGWNDCVDAFHAAMKE